MPELYLDSVKCLKDGVLLRWTGRFSGGANVFDNVIIKEWGKRRGILSVLDVLC